MTLKLYLNKFQLYRVKYNSPYIFICGFWIVKDIELGIKPSCCTFRIWWAYAGLNG